MRHRLCLAAAAAALIAGASACVEAMPLAPGALVSDNPITLVRDGCGPFGHRSHYGYCKQNGDDGDGYVGGGYGGGYGGPRYGGGPRFFEEPGYGERRCVVRDTYDGPRRFCR